MIINPDVPNPYINKKTNRTKVNNIISNPIYPLFDSKLNNLIIREEIPKRKIVHNDEDEKEDDHIKELLKGHKNIIINKKNVKKKRKINKKRLEQLLLPIKIATYNTYNPTPEKIEKIIHSNNLIIPPPLHHNSLHPSTFNHNDYKKKMRKEKLRIKNDIETTNLITIVNSHVKSSNNSKSNKKSIKKKDKKNKKAKKPIKKNKKSSSSIKKKNKK